MFMMPRSVHSLIRILNPYSDLLLSSFVSSQFHPICRSTLPSIVANNSFSTYRISAGEDQNMENTKRACSLSPAKRFWYNSTRDAAFSLYSPFVVCMASGTLDIDVFRRYIVQDKNFLQAFAHAYEMVEKCLDCVDNDARDTVTQLRVAVLEELKMHNSVCKEWGVDVTKEIKPNFAMTKYADFLHAIAMGSANMAVLSTIATAVEKTKMAARTICAMTPCMRLYAFIGHKLESLLQIDGNNHTYKNWIDNYSAVSFQASSFQIEKLLDKLTISSTDEELEYIERLYKQAMKLEIEFFYAQKIVQGSLVPLIRLHGHLEQQHFIIFSDFDLTCTVVDSCAILAEVAISNATKHDQCDFDFHNSKISSEDLKKSWNDLSRQYIEGFKQWMQGVLVSKKVEEFNYKKLLDALEVLSKFEKLSNLRVIESGLFKGLMLDDIKQAGRCLPFQDGCIDFFEKIVKEKKLNTDLHLLSFCWCGDLIRSAFTKGGLDALNTYSNDFCYEGSTATGEIFFRLESPMDKIETFQKILNSKKGAKSLSVFIGDSLGDLLCLLEADIGIVIGSSSSLRKVGEHFGVTFQPLFNGLVKKQHQFSKDGRMFSWNSSNGTLYTVSSWAEIHAFVLGSDNI